MHNFFGSIRAVSPIRGPLFFPHIFGEGKSLHFFLNPSLTYIKTDVCHQGDSGGPLTQEVAGPAGNQSFLIGITSWGIGCGEVNIPTPGLSEQFRSNSAQFCNNRNKNAVILNVL